MSSLNKKVDVWGFGLSSKVTHHATWPLLATDKEQANKALRENRKTTHLTILCSKCRTRPPGGAHVCHFIVISLFKQVSAGAGIMSLSAGQLPADIITLLCGPHWVGILISCLSKTSACHGTVAGPLIPLDTVWIHRNISSLLEGPFHGPRLISLSTYTRNYRHAGLRTCSIQHMFLPDGRGELFIFLIRRSDKSN